MNKLGAFRHLKSLCDQHGLQVTAHSDVNYSGALKKSRLVHIPVPRTMQDYLGALHEIGHLVADGGSPRKRDDHKAVWECEVIASRWALENSSFPVPDEGVEFLADCLRSYWEPGIEGYQERPELGVFVNLLNRKE